MNLLKQFLRYFNHPSADGMVIEAAIERLRSVRRDLNRGVLKPLRPADWLDLSVDYRGRGHAVFTNPASTVNGSASVRFGLPGIETIRIAIDDADAADSTVQAKTPTPADHRFQGNLNLCESVEVQTSNGRFSSTADALVTGGDLLGHPIKSIELTCIRSVFEVCGRESAKAEYWVLPLRNFVIGNWPGPWLDLTEHPLRIFPTPKVADRLEGEAKESATKWANAKNHLQTFLMDEKPGFIERLPDYDRRVSSLMNDKVDCIVTAVMVGPARKATMDFADYTGLFPIDILNLLTLATGTPVGAPWIEFRDGEGKLIRRVHIDFGHRRFHQGHAAIFTHAQGNAIGNLLTCALRSSEIGQSYLRVAMSHANAAAERMNSLEERFVCICRGLETMSYRHGCSEEHLAAVLDTNQQQQVKVVVSEAKKALIEMRNAEREPAKKRALDRIVSRVVNAGNKETDFGLAVVALCRKFGFPDPEILQAHLDANPRPDGQKTWAGLLSMYRGAATHRAYFQIHDGTHDHRDAHRVMDHMHDLLIRMILKTLQFGGQYQSPIPPNPRFDPVDWVTPSTTPAQLGYV